MLNLPTKPSSLPLKILFHGLRDGSPNGPVVGTGYVADSPAAVVPPKNIDK